MTVERVARQGDIDALEVVLTGAGDDDVRSSAALSDECSQRRTDVLFVPGRCREKRCSAALGGLARPPANAQASAGLARNVPSGRYCEQARVVERVRRAIVRRRPRVPEDPREFERPPLRQQQPVDVAQPAAPGRPPWSPQFCVSGFFLPLAEDHVQLR